MPSINDAYEKGGGVKNGTSFMDGLSLRVKSALQKISFEYINEISSEFTPKRCSVPGNIQQIILNGGHLG